MKRPSSLLGILFFLMLLVPSSHKSYGQNTPAEDDQQIRADVILKNGTIYTLDQEIPFGKSIAISKNKIVLVSEEEFVPKNLIGPKTRVIDLKGRFVMPGFVDAHTHFASFAAQKADINLMRVNNDAGLIKELKRVTPIVGAGQWITGGQWEGYKLWLAGWKNVDEVNKNRWKPNRFTVDKWTPKNPVFLNSYDEKLFLANTLALKEAGLESKTLKGMHLGSDGKPTGLIDAGSPAIEKIRKIIQPKSKERLLNELRIAFRLMASMGITEIHDMTGNEVMRRYVKLQGNGELTARVWMRPHLVDVQEVVKSGSKMNHHPITGQRDHYLRWGAFKAHYDGLMGSHGALLFTPYKDKPDFSGSYRCCTSTDRNLLKPDLNRFDEMLFYAAKNGFIANTHAIGPRGVSELLDAYERLSKKTGKPLERYRIIHAQTIRPQDFKRIKDLNLIVEVNPYMIEDDMRWIGNRLGEDRVRWAFPLGTFVKNKIPMTIGSDIPGAAGATFTNDPIFVLHTAVTRTRPDGTPKGGWFPKQKISMEKALEAYTKNAAYASFDEKVKGQLTKGKLADLVVLNKNPLTVDQNKILSVKVHLTMVDGKIVYEKK